MDEVAVFGVAVERIVIQAAVGLMLLGAAYGGTGVWRSTNTLTAWRIARCLIGAGTMAVTTLIAGYVGAVALYVGGSLFPDPLLFAVWPLSIVVWAAVAWASARVLLWILTDQPTAAYAHAR